MVFVLGGFLGDVFFYLIFYVILLYLYGGEGGYEYLYFYLYLYLYGYEVGGYGYDYLLEMVVGFWVLVGLIVFFMVEKFVWLVKGGYGYFYSVLKIEVKNGDVVIKMESEIKDFLFEEIDKELWRRKKVDEMIEKEIKIEIVLGKIEKI